MNNNHKPQINFDDWSKLDIRVGTILSAEIVPNTDKLLQLRVDFGEIASSDNDEEPTNVVPKNDIRQIVSGIANHFKPEELIGLQCPFIINLEPRMIKGVESNGMILAVGTDKEFSLLHPSSSVTPGSSLR